MHPPPNPKIPMGIFYIGLMLSGISGIRNYNNYKNIKK